MLNAIVGSLYVAGGATILGLLVSIPVAIYINWFLLRRSFLFIEIDHLHLGSVGATFFKSDFLETYLVKRITSNKNP